MIDRARSGIFDGLTWSDSAHCYRVCHCLGLAWKLLRAVAAAVVAMAHPGSEDPGCNRAVMVTRDTIRGLTATVITNTRANV